MHFKSHRLRYFRKRNKPDIVFMIFSFIIFAVIWLVFLNQFFPNYEGKSAKRVDSVQVLNISWIESYTLNNPQLCKHPSDLTILQLITSNAESDSYRKKIRRGFPQEILKKLRVKRLFLLAKPFLEMKQRQVTEEFLQHGDLVEGQFQESYQNLTYKHLMGLNWALRYCQNAQYILKQDDDIIVDLYHLVDMILKNQHPFKDSHSEKMFGKILSKQPIIREPSSKWYVSVNHLPGQKFYPPFLSGWGYLMNQRALQKLMFQFENNLTIPYLHIDDAFVTGILRTASGMSEPMDISSMFTTFKGHLLCCINHDAEKYWCDYLIGPTIQDLKLIPRFLSNSRYCFESKSCHARPESLKLFRTCVVTQDMANFYDDTTS